jgi:hypothetical protein
MLSDMNYALAAGTSPSTQLFTPPPDHHISRAGHLCHRAGFEPSRRRLTGFSRPLHHPAKEINSLPFAFLHSLSTCRRSTREPVPAYPPGKWIIGREGNEHLAKDDFNSVTYYSATRGCLLDYSLPIEMMHRDSVNDLCIETFSMIGKQIEEFRNIFFEKLTLKN